MKSVSGVIFLTILLFGTGASLPVMAAQTPTTRVPPGFENLAAFGESVSIDVRLGGRSIGMFAARVTRDDVIFSDPDRLLSALPLKKNIDQKDQTILLQRLERPMLRHDDLMCGFQGKEAPGCGYMASKSIDIIYDEANEQASVFIDKAFLDVAGPAHSAWFSPSPDVSRAFIQRNALAVAGSAGYRSASFNARAVLGTTENSFIASDYSLLYNASAWGQEALFDVSNLYYRYDLGRNVYLQAGRMDARDLSTPTGGTFSFTMLPVQRVDGFRIGTTQAYLNPESESRRTPVPVLLTQDARVDTYRGSQLLSSSYFRSGIHQIDTSSFPPGSYLLTLHVIENGREVRTESMPFSRTDGGFGTPGDVQWFVEAGKSDPVAYSAFTHAGTALGGIKLSVSGNTDLTFGVAYQHNRLFSEGRLDWRHTFSAGQIDANATIFAGSDGSRGHAEDLSWSGPFSASLSWSDSRSPDCSTSRAASCEQFLTASLSHPLWGWLLRGGLTHASSEWQYGYLAPGSDQILDPMDRFQRTSYFPPGSLHQVWIHQRSRSSTVQLSASHVFDWRNTDIDTDLSVYFRRGDQHIENGVALSLNIHRAERLGTGADALGLDSSLTYNAERTAQGLTNHVGMSATVARDGALQESGGGSLAADDSGSIDANVYGRVQSERGSANIGISDHYQARSGVTTPAFNGGYSGTIVASSAGVFAGDDTGGYGPMAAVIVSVKGGDARSSQPVASVRGDGLATQSVRSGASVFLPQRAYRPVDIDIEDPNVKHGGGIASVTDGLGKKSWFIVPGHVGRQFATAEFTYTYVGCLYANARHGLSDGIILDGDFTELDDDGAFVADFHHRPKVLDVLSGKSLYECKMPSMNADQALYNIHTVQCRPVSSDALPDYVKHDTKVRRLLADHHVAMPTALADVRKVESAQRSRTDG